jgi:transposase-like protein
MHRAQPTFLRSRIDAGVTGWYDSNALASATGKPGSISTQQASGQRVVAQAAEEADATATRHDHPTSLPATARPKERSCIEHRQHKGLNNRAENSHQPTRRRERQKKQFKSVGQAQRFLSAQDQINNLLHLQRDHVTAAEHQVSRTQRFKIWAEICSVGRQ